jgi:excisionase family DNA binding protein
MKAKKAALPPARSMIVKQPDQERTLTISEVAELDRCSEKTVRRAIAAGLLEATRIGPGQRLLRITPGAHARYRKLQRA